MKRMWLLGDTKGLAGDTKGMTEGEVPALLERSRASLDSFHVQGMSMTQQEILDCLRVSPGLKSLTISGPHLNASFIKHLTIRPDENDFNRLSPEIERIYIAHCFLADARDYVASMSGVGGSVTVLVL